ncbi:hypothetical protein P12x_002717 [Tundrisphaera lichenicola]|uniref:hypothetical protein n=1 Tax=Tundrisphaera lichenicola TaxID=2029860 RepID=UPI003EBFBA89
MATTQTGDRDKPADGIQRDSLNEHIGRQVVRSLGTPKDLLKVQVKPLGGDRYRVNVLVGKSPNTARITDSFFLTADGEGNIVTSSPAIAKLY